MMLPLPTTHCPIRVSSRPAFTATEEIVSMLNPILVEHCDHKMKAQFLDPTEF